MPLVIGYAYISIFDMRYYRNTNTSDITQYISTYPRCRFSGNKSRLYVQKINPTTSSCI